MSTTDLNDFYERATWFLEARGYRRCDIPACNCPYWHYGHAEQRLEEIANAIPHNGKTILQAVEECVSEVESLRQQLTAAQAEVNAVKVQLSECQKTHGATFGADYQNWQVSERRADELASQLAAAQAEVKRLKDANEKTLDNVRDYYGSR